MSAFVGRAFANIGWSASPDLYAAFQGMPYIKDGTSSKLIYVLTTPWCPKSPELFRDSRGVVESGQVSLAWIPFSGGQPEGSNAVQAFLEKSDKSSEIQSMFIGIKTGTAKGITPLADEMDHLVVTKLERMIIRDTGMGIKTPTLVYAIGNSVRIIPGAINKEDIEKVAASII